MTKEPRRTYLRNKITDNVFCTRNPEDYFGSANRFSDGSALYERSNRVEFEKCFQRIHGYKPRAVYP